MSRIETKPDEAETKNEDLIETLFMISNQEITENDQIIYKDGKLADAPDCDKLAVCVPTDLNGKGGIAQELINKFDNVYEVNSKRLRKNLKVGECSVEKNTRTVFFLGTREFSSDTTSYERLDNCLENLVEKCKELNISSVAFAKYGYGLDKLDWNKVKSMINKRVIGQNIQCTVYLNHEVVSNLNEVDLSLDTKLKQLQKKDEFASGKIKEIEKKKKVKGYILENGVLLKLRKTKNNRIYKQLVVPNELKSDVFK